MEKQEIYSEKKQGKILIVLLIIISFCILCFKCTYCTYSVMAAEKYYGYQKKTKTVRHKTKTYNKKSGTKKNYKNKTTHKQVSTKWSENYKCKEGVVTKNRVDTVTTVWKTYYKHTIITKKKIKTTTTENKIMFIRNQKKLTINGRIPEKVQKDLEKEKIKVVLNPKINCNGIFSLRNRKISLKNNSDYVLLHEIGHFIDYKKDYISNSQEFQNIYRKEKRKYRGFYNDYYKKLDFGKYERSDIAEYFAGAYRDYYFSKDSRKRLKKYCPNTYYFLQKYCK